MRQALVDFGQREVGIEHAQDLLICGMRVAGGIGAGRLVLDGGDDAQHPRAIGAIDTEAVGTIQPRQRLGLLMASIAGLGALDRRWCPLQLARWNS